MASSTRNIRAFETNNGFAPNINLNFDLARFYKKISFLDPFTMLSGIQKTAASNDRPLYPQSYAIESNVVLCNVAVMYRTKFSCNEPTKTSDKKVQQPFGLEVERTPQS